MNATGGVDINSEDSELFANYSTGANRANFGTTDNPATFDDKHIRGGLSNTNVRFETDRKGDTVSTCHFMLPKHRNSERPVVFTISLTIPKLEIAPELANGTHHGNNIIFAVDINNVPPKKTDCYVNNEDYDERQMSDEERHNYNTKKQQYREQIGYVLLNSAKEAMKEGMLFCESFTNHDNVKDNVDISVDIKFDKELYQELHKCKSRVSSGASIANMYNAISSIMHGKRGRNEGQINSPMATMSANMSEYGKVTTMDPKMRDEIAKHVEVEVKMGEKGQYAKIAAAGIS